MQGLDNPGRGKIPRCGIFYIFIHFRALGRRSFSCPNSRRSASRICFATCCEDAIPQYKNNPVYNTTLPIVNVTDTTTLKHHYLIYDIEWSCSCFEKNFDDIHTTITVYKDISGIETFEISSQPSPISISDTASLYIVAKDREGNTFDLSNETPLAVGILPAPDDPEERINGYLIGPDGTNAPYFEMLPYSVARSGQIKYVADFPAEEDINTVYIGDLIQVIRQNGI